LKRLMLVIFLLLNTGCDGANNSRIGPPVPPLADLEGSEPAVAQHIAKRHQALAENPSATTWKDYARALHAHDLKSEAADAWLKTNELLDGRDFECLYLAGCVQAHLNPLDAAVNLQQALEIDPEYVPAWMRLGWVHERLGNLPQARRSYEGARSRYEKRGDRSVGHALLGLGRIALSENKLEEARKILEQARQILPRASEVHATLATVYQRLDLKDFARLSSLLAGDVAHSSSYSDDFIVKVVDSGVSFSCRERVGIAQLAAGNYQQAVSQLDRALKIRKDAWPTRYARARALVGLKRFEEAALDLEKYTRVLDDDHRALSLLGHCLYSIGEGVEAEKHLARAHKLAPTNLEILRNYAVVLDSLKKRQEATEVARTLVTLAPDFQEGVILLARVLTLTEKIHEAMGVLKVYLERHPEDARIQTALKKLEELSNR